MKSIRSVLILVSCIALASCGGKEPENLNQVDQKRVDDYNVVVLTDPGAPSGTNEFYLEFRRSSDNSLVDVGDVSVAASMSMPGTQTMTGDIDVGRASMAGRYRVEGKFPMAGSWRFTVSFAGGKTASFSLSMS